MILVSGQVAEDSVIFEIKLGNLALNRCDLLLSLIRAVLNILVQRIEQRDQSRDAGQDIRVVAIVKRLNCSIHILPESFLVRYAERKAILVLFASEAIDHASEYTRQFVTLVGDSIRKLIEIELTVGCWELLREEGV